jgi:hydroxylamine reductase (hybrid-cluster protein)
MSILNGYYKLYTYYPDNKEMLEELYMELLNYLDEADSDDLMNVYFDEPDYFEINSELPEIAEKLMMKIGEKLLALDGEETIETLNNFEGCGGTYKVSDLPNDAKEKFLEKIESLSDEEKEEIYELDEIVENLKG